MEVHAVSRIRRVAAEHPPGRDNPHRRLMGLHHPDLHRAGLRAKNPPVGKIEGVLRVAGGMVRRRVERVEVVIDVLDLRPLRDDEPHPAEDRHALVGQHRDRVLVPRLPAPPRQRQVDRVTAAGTGRLQPGGGVLDQLLNLPAAGVERTAGLTPLLRRNLPHLPGERRKKSVAPEIIDPQLLDRRGIGGLSRPPLRIGERLIDFFYNRIH